MENIKTRSSSPFHFANWSIIQTSVKHKLKIYIIKVCLCKSLLLIFFKLFLFCFRHYLEDKLPPLLALLKFIYLLTLIYNFIKYSIRDMLKRGNFKLICNVVRTLKLFILFSVKCSFKFVMPKTMHKTKTKIWHIRSVVLKWKLMIQL